MLIPKNILEQGEKPQWQGKINDVDIEVYYDDVISKSSTMNHYAVFSEKGFHGWVCFGFTLLEIIAASKLEPCDYAFAAQTLDN